MPVSGSASHVLELSEDQTEKRLCFFLCLVLNICIVVFRDQEVAFRIHTVLDLRNSKEHDDDQCNTEVAKEAHCNGEEGPYGIPVEHSEISAVVCKSDPAGDESRSEDLDQSGEEGDDQASFETALFIRNKADGGVVEEDRNESADDQCGGSDKDQCNDSNELACKTCEESESNSVGIAETIADCAVNARNRCGQELVSNTLEGCCQLGNECAHTKLQDCKVNCELQGSVEDVECEVFSFFCCAACNEEGFADNEHDGSEEYGHQDSGTNHVLIEDGEESGHLEVADLLDLLLAVFVAEQLLSEPGSETDTEHLLVSNGESCAFGEFLHGLYREVGADCPVSTEDDGHDDEKSNVVFTK